MTQESNRRSRIFVTGSTCIVEDESLAGLDNEAVRALLRNTYPEVAHAIIREHDDPDSGYRYVEFTPIVGRKG